jgi:hypothetical protein
MMFGGVTSRWTMPSGAADLAAHLGNERGRELLARPLDAPAQQPRHVDPLDRLHHQVVAAVLERELEHLDDVRVDEAGGDVRLVDEHPHELGLARQARVDALEHERPREAGRSLADGAEHLGHPAATNLLRQPVFHGTRTLATSPGLLDSAISTRRKVVLVRPVATR